MGRDGTAQGAAEETARQNGIVFIMGKTYTDFSQLSKGMFKKNAPVDEIKPLPKTNAVGGDDALSFFGLNAPETPTGASDGGAGDGRILALEADVRAVRAESAALDAAKAEAERKAGDLERQLAAERQMREAAEAERERLRGEVMRLRNELEDALTAPPAPSAIAACTGGACRWPVEVADNGRGLSGRGSGTRPCRAFGST